MIKRIVLITTATMLLLVLVGCSSDITCEELADEIVEASSLGLFQNPPIPDKILVPSQFAGDGSLEYPNSKHFRLVDTPTIVQITDVYEPEQRYADVFDCEGKVLMSDGGKGVGEPNSISFYHGSNGRDTIGYKQFRYDYVHLYPPNTDEDSIRPTNVYSANKYYK
tara:strand:- start:3451 stop:3948 length:498 start_codon:yes stop_codon:yes gene_type:complete